MQKNVFRFLIVLVICFEMLLINVNPYYPIK